MNRAETIAAIRAAWNMPDNGHPFEGSILVCDPDAHEPGVAYYTPTHGSQLARCWVWGGNKGSAHLASARSVAWLLRTLAPSLLVVEGALASGGAWAHSMHEHAIVRGGWCWAADLAGIPRVVIDPGVWQGVIVPHARGKGSRKPAYKKHARDLMRKKAVNEDAAAALCLLDFTLRAIGLTLPENISDVAP